ncbi:HMG domain-containing protein 3 isoform X1 [Thunnus maccoyii]|uniref:HMG domain-containing protein 3 isoform X1 n=2 Tax=Thunnus maccoyii TaxID=8240 RepID=UPI001C4DD67D|nr:HMG domain-containing protein 3 isoform X1 [Thunnus maccoyii]XP_042274692.1 HMG domain-containing protein 3 isoform X1 [Thunnus maccoyii]XP_042274693.1 HMG domain-containing protein 3 isoform X1 [Thunnus maccoyii]XP_042274694.1 HMG domain-containing protein 3 isoform X1 [Thunnus maccoyii]
MEKVKVYEVVKVTDEVESCYNQMEVTPPKKRKSKAHEDNVEKPKKPRSAYLLYYFDVHQMMQQEVPNLPQSEINKRISESWKRLSVAEKSYYLEKAKSEKEGIDTSSVSPSRDLPGFRKILPRASYFLLAKGCSSNHQPGFCQPEVSMESLDPPPEGGLPSASLTQEPQFQPLGLAGEVELSEQLIVVDDIAEETAAASHPTTLQGIPPSSSSSISSKAPASTDARVSQNSADLTANRVTLKGNETRVAGSGYGGAMVQQIQGETTQVVAIIPTQNLLETKSLAGVSSVGPVMMVSVGGSAERSATPSYKMSVKTYTRRGRGRCLNPGCSFVYVTRHKPPTCPECGSHLGGKWIPAAKKTQEKEAASKQLPEKAETKSKESCQATSPCAQEGCADVSKTNTHGSKKDGQVQRCGKKQRAVPAVKPPEGSSIKSQEQTEQLKDSLKSATVQSQSRSSTAVQKRPVRPILPAYCSTGRAVFQIITVPPDKGKFQTANNNKSSSVPRESFSGLKPSTLKQLGQAVTTTAKQDSPVAAEGNQPVASLTDRRVNIVSVVPFKQHTVSNFDLGLSTARGRGRCKNPFCDYMYKNRHKPAVCPKCGCELTQRNAKGTKSGTLLDPYQALSAAQKDLQRQSTLQLLRRSLLIPESETELQETLTLIQELNSLQIVLVQPGDQEQEDGTEAETLVESGWPQFYESAATHCSLCNYPLFKGDQSTVAGQEDCWLLTETLIQTASLQLKVCLNVQCLALHSFTDLHPGLFNIGNKLLVSIDLFLKIRANLKLGHPPSQVAKTLLDHVPNHPVHALSPEESSQIQELLLSGYWAFECLTVRDYNDMICGICGVAPKLEISQRYTNNVLELKNVEFTWPEFSISDEVHVDDFWLTMESEAIEQAAFPTDIPITRVDASIIAPFIPPLMRSPTVINTEKDKVLSHTQQPSGDPSVLVRLIHDGQLRLDKIEDHSEDELRTILDRCRASITPGSTKNELLASLISLYTLVHGGLATAPQPPQHLTAGKLSKVCPHKVVCGSKYLVRGETARDHVDLLLSSRYWPPVYVNDCARQVALCADMQYPELAAQMWGRNQGCFSDPFEKPVFVSCAELEDQPYSADQSLVGENQQVHPITKSSSCWLVYPPGAAQAHDPPAPEHHSLALCRDLEPYISLVAELEKEKEEKEDEEGVEQEKQIDKAEEDSTENPEDCSSVSHMRRQPVVFNNTAYYYLYNRLVDFLSSRDIVNQQINQVVKACQPGEVVIRDALYRLGVAQINTEREEDEGSGMEGQKQEEGAETTYEVVLPE